MSTCRTAGCRATCALHSGLGAKEPCISLGGIGQRADRLLVVGADVSVGEKIVTGPSGNVQLLFQDQTRLVVGPRSTLEIETYLLSGSGADKFAVNALAAASWSWARMCRSVKRS